jgi:hypothetical protein
MASEQVPEVPMRRHVFDSERPFAAVLDGIFGGISQPDIEALFSKLAASTSYEQFSSLVQQAQGSIGLMRFLQLDCDSVLTLDPQAPDWDGRRLVRLIAGNPVTMGQMTRHVADAGSTRRSPSSSSRYRTAEPEWLTTQSPARSLPTTTRPPPKSPSNSTQRCLTSCVR